MGLCVCVYFIHPILGDTVLVFKKQKLAETNLVKCVDGSTAHQISEPESSSIEH